MTIKQQGGIFGRNPTFNNVTIDGTLSGVSSLALSGNLVLADGQGIDFSATSGTGTSELLNDYEEGTWTPVLESTGTFPTVSSYLGQNGHYTKVGRLVSATCLVRATLSAIGSGYPVISGLPYTSNTYHGGSGVLTTMINASNDNTSASKMGIGTYGAGSSSVIFYYSTYNLTASSYVYFTVNYMTS